MAFENEQEVTNIIQQEPTKPAQKQDADYVGLRLMGYSDAQIDDATKGGQKANVILMPADAALEKYKKQGIINDDADFFSKYESFAKGYDQYKRGNWHNDLHNYSGRPQTNYMHSATRDFLFGKDATRDITLPERIKEGGTDRVISPFAGAAPVEVITDQQEAVNREFYIDWATKEKKVLDTGKLPDYSQVLYDNEGKYGDAGQPYVATYDKQQYHDVENVISSFGPSELYSSWASKAFGGIYDSWIANKPAVVGSLAKVAKDAAWGTYDLLTKNGGQVFNDKGELDIDLTGKRSSNVSKVVDTSDKYGVGQAVDRFSYNLRNYSNQLYTANDADDAGSLTKEAFNGFGSLIDMITTGYAVGKVAKFSGASNMQAANIAQQASLGAGTLPVIDMFLNEAKRAGIPDYDASLLALPIGMATYASEKYFSPKFMTDFFGKTVGREEVQKIIQREIGQTLKDAGVETAEALSNSAKKNLVGRISHGIIGAVEKAKKAVGDRGVFGAAATGYIEEATEEGAEQLSQNAIKASYDAMRTYKNSPLYDANAKPEHGVFNNDFSIPSLFDGVGHSMTIGGLVGGVGGAGFSAFNGGFKKRFAAQTIEDLVIRGKKQDLIDMATSMHQKGMLGYGHVTKDGKPITYGEQAASINDDNYNQFLSQVNLIDELHKNAGLQDPKYIKEVLGGDQTLVREALDNLVKQNDLKQEIGQLQAEREAQVKAGTFVPPANEEQDGVLQRQNALTQLQDEYQKINNGTRYSEKLKDANIANFLSRDGNKMPLEYASDYRRRYDDFYGSLEQRRQQEAEAQQQKQEAQAEQRKSFGDRIADFGKFETANTQLLSDIKSLQAEIEQIGATQEDVEALNAEKQRRKAEALNNIRTSFSDEQLAAFDAVPDTATQNIIDQAKTDEGLAEMVSQYEELSTEGGSNIFTQPNFDENAFITKAYTSFEYIAPDGQTQSIPARDIINALRSKGVVSANDVSQIEAALSQVIYNQIKAGVNKSVYQKLDKKHTGLNDSNSLTDEQYAAITLENLSLERELKDMLAAGDIAKQAILAKQERIKTEDFKVKASVLKRAVDVLDMAKKDAEALGLKVEAFEELLEKYQTAKANGEPYDKILLDIEASLLSIEQLVHEELVKPKNADFAAKIYDVFNATGQLSSTSYYETNGFSGAVFEQVFSADTFGGLLDKTGVSKDTSNAFVKNYVVNYIQNLRRISPEQFYSAYRDVVSDLPQDANMLSYEQEQAVRHIVSFFQSSDNSFIGDFNKQFGFENSQAINNSIFLSGFTETGKTGYVVGLAHNIITKIKGSKVNTTTVAINNTSLSELNDAILDTRLAGKSFSFDDMLVGDITGSELVIIENAELLTVSQAENINNKLERMPNVRAIFIGNTISPVNIGQTAIVQGMMEKTMPLSTQFESGSNDIIYLKNAVANAVFAGNQDVSLPTSFHNNENTQGVGYYKSEQEVFGAFISNVQQGNDAVLVVKDDNARDAVIKKYAGQVGFVNIGNRIKTVSVGDNTIVGFKYPSVFVLMPQSEFWDNQDKYSNVLAALQAAEGFAGVYTDTEIAQSTPVEKYTPINITAPSLGSMQELSERLEYIYDNSDVRAVETEQENEEQEEVEALDNEEFADKVYDEQDAKNHGVEIGSPYVKKTDRSRTYIPTGFYKQVVNGKLGLFVELNNQQDSPIDLNTFKAQYERKGNVRDELSLQGKSLTLDSALKHHEGILYTNAAAIPAIDDKPTAHQFIENQRQQVKLEITKAIVSLVNSSTERKPLANLHYHEVYTLIEGKEDTGVFVARDYVGVVVATIDDLSVVKAAIKKVLGVEMTDEEVRAAKYDFISVASLPGTTASGTNNDIPVVIDYNKFLGDIRELGKKHPKGFIAQAPIASITYGSFDIKKDSKEKLFVSFKQSQERKGASFNNEVRVTTASINGKNMSVVAIDASYMGNNFAGSERSFIPVRLPEIVDNDIAAIKEELKTLAETETISMQDVLNSKAYAMLQLNRMNLNGERGSINDLKGLSKLIVSGNYDTINVIGLNAKDPQIGLNNLKAAWDILEDHYKRKGLTYKFSSMEGIKLENGRMTIDYNDPITKDYVESIRTKADSFNYPRVYVSNANIKAALRGEKIVSQQPVTFTEEIESAIDEVFAEPQSTMPDDSFTFMTYPQAEQELLQHLDELNTGVEKEPTLSDFHDAQGNIIKTIEAANDFAIQYVVNDFIEFNEPTAKDGKYKKKNPNLAPRLNLDMSSEEKIRAINQIKKGDYNAVAASTMISKISAFYMDGYMPFIQGNGGNSNVVAFPVDEAILHLEEQKISNMLIDSYVKKAANIPGDIAEAILTNNIYSIEDVEALRGTGIETGLADRIIKFLKTAKNESKQSTKSGAGKNNATKSAAEQNTQQQGEPAPVEPANVTQGTPEITVSEVIPYTTVEANNFRPEEQLKFNQGEYYGSVTIVGNPDLIKLIEIGSKLSGGRSKLVNPEYRQKLEAELGISAFDAIKKAKDLAKQVRDKNIDVIAKLSLGTIESVTQGAVQITEGLYRGVETSLRGVKYSDIIVGDKHLEDILDENKLSDTEKEKVRDIFSRTINYFKFDKKGEQKFQEKFSNPEDITDVADIITGVSAAQQSDFNFYNTKNYENVKDTIDYIVDNPNEYNPKIVRAVKEIKQKLDNPSSSMNRLYAIDVMKELGIKAQGFGQITEQQHLDLMAKSEVYRDAYVEGISMKWSDAKAKEHAKKVFDNREIC